MLEIGICLHYQQTNGLLVETCNCILGQSYTAVIKFSQTYVKQPPKEKGKYGRLLYKAIVVH